ncbi:DUF6482 family protein [Vreelandella aquamarina]
MPDTMTLKELAQHVPDDTFEIEIQALDMGWYFVRLHGADNTVLTLVDESGKTLQFTGTQWVSRSLLPLGFTHATLTYPSVTDEMIGMVTRPLSPEELMASGTRVSFETL